MRSLLFKPAGLLVLLVLAVGCRPTAAPSSGSSHPADSLTVYCAAGIRLPVEAAAKRYEQEYGRAVRIDYGSSGELEGRLELDRQANKSNCDLYIPADASFVQRTQRKGLTAESLPLAEFHLVLATHPEADVQATSIDEVLGAGFNYVICDKAAGVGAKTHKILSAIGKWDALDAGKKGSFPRVTEAANAIKTADDVQAGFIWDTTAHQFGLDVKSLPELKGATSRISVNVVSNSEHPTAALAFARFLAAIDRGQEAFRKFGFTPVGTDQWNDHPELIVYCGGVNRNAVNKTLRDFEQREGVTIREQYAGCGTLVSGIQAIAVGESRLRMPDAFMTCDASYLNKVQDHFGDPSDVSSTQVVLLVRKGNPRKILSLKDLAQPDLAIGTTDRKLSTLGDLSYQLFASAGVLQSIEDQGSVIVTTPTAHELIMQMTGHRKLDVALVYEANCQSLSDDFERIPIDHPRATAIQNIATAKTSEYPALSARLLSTLQSESSRHRFEVQGFQWRSAATTP